MKTFFVVTVLVFSFLYLQKEDYNDEVDFFNQYCADIKSGFYPDYKHIKNECEKGLK